MYLYLSLFKRQILLSFDNDTGCQSCLAGEHEDHRAPWPIKKRSDPSNNANARCQQ